MSFATLGWAWLSAPAQWRGQGDIPGQLLAHLGYSGAGLLAALLVALPLGVLIGHTGRGGFLVVSVANAWRAIPTLGLVVLGVLLLGFSPLAWLIPLAVLGVPPILVNAYEGLTGVDPDVKDAALGMGMTGWQRLCRVEMPLALPLILTGLRTGAIYVVATATLVADTGLGGLGRFIFDGLHTKNYGEAAGGAMLVVALALATLAAFVALRRLVVPTGLRLAASSR